MALFHSRGRVGYVDTATELSHPLHAKTLLDALNENRKNSSLCDGIVAINDIDIPVQRNVLAAASPYFRCRSRLSN
jgi:hypothetical protein